VNGGRTKLLLGVLAVAVVASGWFYFNSDDEAPATGTPRSGAAMDPDLGPAPAAAPSAPRASRPAVPDVLPLRLGDLERTKHTYTPGRDPWRFVDPPPPPPPKPHVPTKAELEALRLAEEARRRAEEEAARLRAIEEARPKPPPFTWTYLGSFGPPNRRVAVFSDGKTIYDALQGDVLAGKFIVAQIGYESVDIRFVGFPEVAAQRLPIGH
jgi:hypothetical protein